MTAVDDLQAATEKLADATAAEVLRIYTTEDDDTAIVLIAGVINRANATAVSLGDTYLASQIEEQTGTATPTTGIPPADDSERLMKAAQTVLKGRPQPETPGTAENRSAPQPGTENLPAEDTARNRLERLARSEPLETAQKATHEAMQKQPLVEGWVRQFDADPCQLCVWWWREGRVWPKEHPFQSHKGCNCHPRVVLRKSIKSTGYTRKLRTNA